MQKNKSYTFSLELLNFGRIPPADLSEPRVKILFENDKFLAVDKFFNTHCYPLSYSDDQNMLSILNSTEVERVNIGQNERGLLFRLDYETSGVLIFSKCTHEYDFVRNSFRDCVKKKQYIAIVQGHFNREGEHSHLLATRGERGSSVYTCQPGKGQSVKAEFYLREYNQERNLSLLEIRLVTGHRHQIRVQLSALGFPILGDTKYGTQSEKRLYLHSELYSFRDSEGNLIEIRSQVPRLFVECLNT